MIKIIFTPDFWRFSGTSFHKIQTYSRVCLDFLNFFFFIHQIYLKSKRFSNNLFYLLYEFFILFTNKIIIQKHSLCRILKCDSNALRFSTFIENMATVFDRFCKKKLKTIATLWQQRDPDMINPSIEITHFLFWHENNFAGVWFLKFIFRK